MASRQLQPFKVTDLGSLWLSSFPKNPTSTIRLTLRPTRAPSWPPAVAAANSSLHLALCKCFLQSKASVPSSCGWKLWIVKQTCIVGLHNNATAIGTHLGSLKNTIINRRFSWLDSILRFLRFDRLTPSLLTDFLIPPFRLLGAPCRASVKIVRVRLSVSSCSSWQRKAGRFGSK